MHPHASTVERLRGDDDPFGGRGGVEDAPAASSGGEYGGGAGSSGAASSEAAGGAALEAAEAAQAARAPPTGGIRCNSHTSRALRSATRRACHAAADTSDRALALARAVRLLREPGAEEFCCAACGAVPNATKHNSSCSVLLRALNGTAAAALPPRHGKMRRRRLAERLSPHHHHQHRSSPPAAVVPPLSRAGAASIPTTNASASACRAARTSSCWPPSSPLGLPTSPMLPGISLRPTETFCAAALSNWGSAQHARLVAAQGGLGGRPGRSPTATPTTTAASATAAAAAAAAATAAAAPAAIEVVVLGGSVSCGSARNATHPDRTCDYDPKRRSNPDTSQCMARAWPAQLQAALAPCFPSVVVTNLCRGAVASDYWAVAATTDERLVAALSRASVVIVETASNDVDQLKRAARCPSGGGGSGGGGGGRAGSGGGGGAGGGGGGGGGGRGAECTSDAAAAHTEALMATLLSLPRRPLLIWLTAAWRRFGEATAESAEAAHLSVARRYGVAHVSVLNGFAPVEGDGALASFLQSTYFQDCCHPTRYGHRLVAAVVAQRIVAARGGGGRRFEGGSAPHLPRLLPPPQTARAAALLARSRNGARVDLSKAADATAALVASASHGWAHLEDVGGKPGLVAREKGAVAVVALPRSASAGRVLLVGALHSYDDAGAVSVEVLSSDACALEGATVVASLPRVETKWTQPTSQRATIELELPDRVPPPAACRWARLATVSDAKVKLLDVALL